MIANLIPADLDQQVDVLPGSKTDHELDSGVVLLNLDEIEDFAVNDQTIDPVEKTLNFSEL